MNGISYWEAHLDGDLQQRVSLKIDHGAVSGSIMLKQHKLVLGHANGESFVTRFGNDYQPGNKQATVAQVFQPLASDARAQRSYRAKHRPRPTGRYRSMSRTTEKRARSTAK